MIELSTLGGRKMDKETIDYAIDKLDKVFEVGQGHDYAMYLVLQEVLGAIGLFVCAIIFLFIAFKLKQAEHRLIPRTMEGFCEIFENNPSHLIFIGGFILFSIVFCFKLGRVAMAYTYPIEWMIQRTL